MFQLHFENQVLSTSGDFELNWEHLPPFPKEAIQFCKEWMEGKEEFTQMTSGSTGTPKIIRISRSQMEASARATGAFFKTNSDSKLLCCLNTGYIAGKMMLVRAMVWDCPIWLKDPSSDDLLASHFDFVAMVPLQIEKILNQPDGPEKLKLVQNLIIGGAPISEKLKQEIIKNQILAWQTFGMTETVSHVALAKIEKDELTYHGLQGVEMGQDERGALWVKAEMSKNEKVQTNDLVQFLSPTTFHWLGRVDFVINSGGIKLFPEILEKKSESLIHTFFPDSRFFFIGKKDEKLGEKLVLIIEAEENKLSGSQLIIQLKSLLGTYESPKEILFTPKFTETENGKINRKMTFENL